MTTGTKRPSGAEEAANIEDVVISDEVAQQLQDIQRELASAELVLERRAHMALLPVFEKRREVIKSIPNFWPVALMNHSMFDYHVQHNADKTALAFLEDVWVEKDPQEHRCFTIEFYFKENQFFSDRVLKKKYTYAPANASAADTQPNKDGITPAMLSFSMEKDVKVEPTKINWKDPENALTKVYPRVQDDELEDDEVADPGSFFNFFEHDSDPSDIGVLIANEIFPEAIEFFLGNAGDDSTDESEVGEDDSGEDGEDIDLEQRKKRRKF